MPSLQDLNIEEPLLGAYIALYYIKLSEEDVQTIFTQKGQNIKAKVSVIRSGLNG